MYSIDVSLNLIREADGTELNAPDLSDENFDSSNFDQGSIRKVFYFVNNFLI